LEKERNMTKHNETIAQFLAANPSWHLVGLRSKLNSIFDAAPIHHLGFIPDAFQIDVDHKTVRLLEVDGESFMRQKKLTRVCDLWFVLDCLDWFCELTTVDLLTGAKSVLSDEQLAYHWHEGCDNALA
jgi:hypothetical protein